MNIEPHPHDQQSAEQPPPAEAAPPDPSVGTAPDAIQAADVDRDPRTAEELDTQRPTRGVDGVCLSALTARAGGPGSRRGIDLQDALSRRPRAGLAAGAQKITAQSRRLPPLSAFGREEPTPEAPALGRK